MTNNLLADILRKIATKENVSIGNVLESIRTAFAADACVLWEPSLVFEPTAIRPTGELCSMSTAPSHPPYLGSLTSSLQKDTTGRLMCDPTRFSVVNNNFPATDGPDVTKFEERMHMRMLCSAKILDANSKTSGAITLYRKTNGTEFCLEDARELESIAGLIPSLYQVVTDRMVLRIVQEVHTRLFEKTTKWNIPEMIGGICKLLADAFHCHEVSLYLKDTLLAPNDFKLQASTWDSGINDVTLRGSEEEGLTGWVLGNLKPLRLFDLAKFQRDEKKIHAIYGPKLRWRDGANVIERAKVLFKTKIEEELPPISYMAAPIVESGRLHGVIRCSLGRNPFHFSTRELDTLELIASMISVWWSDHLAQREKEANTQIAIGMIETMTDVSAKVQEQIRSEEHRPMDLYRAVALGLFQGIHGVPLVAVRLRKNETECEIAALEASEKLYSSEAATSLLGSKVKLCPDSLLYKLIEQSSPEPSETDLSLHTNSEEAKVYKGVHRLLIVPIELGGVFFGSVDVGFTSEESWKILKDQMKEFALIVARTLSAYEFILRRHAELEELKATQMQAYANVAHQLNSPLGTVERRLTRQIERMEDALQQDRRAPTYFGGQYEATLKELVRARGQARSARRVSQSMELLARFSQNRDVPVERTRMSLGALRRRLFQSLQDNQLVTGSYYNISFDIRDPDKLLSDDSDAGHLRTDGGLVSQVFDAVVGNAFKYAFPDTALIASAERRDGSLVIIVADQGLGLSEEDAGKCTEKFWRGDEASDTDAGGSGLGLWLVENIMATLGGKFVPVATNAEGITKMEIHFPLESY